MTEDRRQMSEDGGQRIDDRELKIVGVVASRWQHNTGK